MAYPENQETREPRFEVLWGGVGLVALLLSITLALLALGECRSDSAAMTGSRRPLPPLPPARPEVSFPELPPIPVEVAIGGCPEGCEDPPPNCYIKGNISRDGERIYHLPIQQNYDDTVISSHKGERWFCTEEEAVANGWRRARR